MNKVVVVGFHKTGTTSLHEALQLLGYRVAGHNIQLVHALRSGDLEPVWRLVRDFDAFEDDPWFVLYREIDQKFPGTKFILTERPTAAWLESMKAHFVSNKFRRYLYGTDDIHGSPDLFTSKYEQHNREVKSYFEGRDDLFLFSTGVDSWEPLCKFLNKDVPKSVLSGKVVSFPHTNRQSQRLWRANHRKVVGTLHFVRQTLFAVGGTRLVEAARRARSVVRHRIWPA